jgi:hypothetical protein
VRADIEVLGPSRNGSFDRPPVDRVGGNDRARDGGRRNRDLHRSEGSRSSSIVFDPPARAGSIKVHYQDTAIVEILGWSPMAMLRRYLGKIPVAQLKRYPTTLERIFGRAG